LRVGSKLGVSYSAKLDISELLHKLFCTFAQSAYPLFSVCSIKVSSRSTARSTRSETAYTHLSQLRLL